MSRPLTPDEIRQVKDYRFRTGCTLIQARDAIVKHVPPPPSEDEAIENASLRARVAELESEVARVTAERDENERLCLGYQSAQIGAEAERDEARSALAAARAEVVRQQGFWKGIRDRRVDAAERERDEARSALAASEATVSRLTEALREWVAAEDAMTAYGKAHPDEEWAPMEMHDRYYAAEKALRVLVPPVTPATSPAPTPEE